MKKNFTIKNIAAQAGVSVSTVSRVLNNKPRVSNEVRSRVLDIIKESGYQPNQIAVSMITKKSDIIIVLVPDIVTHFYARIVNSIEQRVRQDGFSTLIFSTMNKSLGEREFFEGRFAKMVDGVIVIPSEENNSPYLEYDKPVVFVDRFLDIGNYDSVTIDNYRGSYLLGKHLVEAGHTDIALITGTVKLNVGRERIYGFEQALREQGLVLPDSRIITGDWYSETGYNATLDLLEKKNRPTAICATNQPICEGVLRALQKKNVTIPDEISVVGFDNFTQAEEHVPPITVIDRPTEEMGIVAAEMLLERMDHKIGQSKIAKRVVLPVTLIERASVKHLCGKGAE